MSERKTTEQFIKDAKNVYGDKYDYSETEYINSITKVKIFCKECNEYFWKRPINHIAGKQGCPECGKKERDKKHFSNTSEFIEKAKKIHGDKYDYSIVGPTKCESETYCLRDMEHNYYSMVALFGDIQQY